MKRTYGGVKNSKAYEEVQEAFVVGKPKSVPEPPRSTGSIIGGWIAFSIISFFIIFLLMIITGLSELLIAKQTPLFVSLTIPLLPSIIQLIRIVYKARIKKAHQP